MSEFGSLLSLKSERKKKSFVDCGRWLSMNKMNFESRFESSVLRQSEDKHLTNYRLFILFDIFYNTIIWLEKYQSYG